MAEKRLLLFVQMWHIWWCPKNYHQEISSVVELQNLTWGHWTRWFHFRHFDLMVKCWNVVRSSRDKLFSCVRGWVGRVGGCLSLSWLVPKYYLIDAWKGISLHSGMASKHSGLIRIDNGSRLAFFIFLHQAIWLIWVKISCYLVWWQLCPSKASQTVTANFNATLCEGGLDDSGLIN